MKLAPLLLVIALGQQPPAVILPDFPAPIPPTPPPTGAQPLRANEYFVIRGSVPFTVLASPSGLVSITRETGPLKVRGVFTGGSGKVETKTFTEKYLVFIEATGQGPCELLVIPQGADESGIIRRMLDVGGVGPIPPGPDPTDPLWPALKAAAAAESVADKAKLGDLAAFWTAAATTANDPAVKTVGDLVTALAKAEASFLKTVLPGVRKVIGVELKARLPSSPGQALDGPTRALCAAQFQRMAALVGALK